MGTPAKSHFVFRERGDGAEPLAMSVQVYISCICVKFVYVYVYYLSIFAYVCVIKDMYRGRYLDKDASELIIEERKLLSASTTTYYNIPHLYASLIM